MPEEAGGRVISKERKPVPCLPIAKWSWDVGGPQGGSVSRESQPPIKASRRRGYRLRACLFKNRGLGANKEKN